MQILTIAPQKICRLLPSVEQCDIKGVQRKPRMAAPRSNDYPYNANASANVYQRKGYQTPNLCKGDNWNNVIIYSGFPSSASPSSSMYSRMSLRLSIPISRLSSSMTIRRCTRDFRIVSKMVSRRSSMEQVKMPGKSCARHHEIAPFADGASHTSDRFCKASPTFRFSSSYIPPLMSVMTSTASKTLVTTPSLLTIGTLDMELLTS